ncbi:tetraspanin-31-like [Oscarella lobularis]|uniref:tetraspanin-31-like n=1 Tax=Oscarella lobularis TaxID=121494 RepID=UPI00331390A9
MGSSPSSGFFHYRNVLIVLNVFYLIVALILIGAPAAAIASAKFTSVPIVAGVIASGVFLFLVAVLGLVGAAKHHQVALFFYMILLGIVFIILFAVSVAAVAVTSSQQQTLAAKAWNASSLKTQKEIQTLFNCCGFKKSDTSPNRKSCLDLKCCTSTVGALKSNSTEKPSNISTNSPTTPSHGAATIHPPQYCLSCPGCFDKLEKEIHKAFKVGGGVGLFFSFTELIGLILTIYYRNRKDPSANPNAFL